jgi:hypothetical protein
MRPASGTYRPYAGPERKRVWRRLMAQVVTYVNTDATERRQS